MRYRNLGDSRIKVPALGFGAMRMPMLKARRDTKRRTGVDVEEAVRMMHRAFDLGASYFDTAYGYHQGWSEPVVGKALKSLPRDRFMVATKMPVWLVSKPSDFNRLLRTQLRRLGTGYLDFYLLHALNKQSFEKARDFGVLDFLEAQKRQGRIRHTGFSYHDRASNFRPILDAYEWELCQVQYNIVDTRYQAGQSGVRYAARRGIGVVVMEPLRGGDLVNRLPPDIERIWSLLRPKRPPVEWALRWLWNQPEVSMVLSGMSSMGQLEQNAGIASRARKNSLTPEQLKAVSLVRAAYRRRIRVNCTNCGYCLPCPSGVDIPRNFSILNDHGMFLDSPAAVTEYNDWMSEDLRASNCTGCGQCVPRCPQQIPIPEKLQQVHKKLART
ncbi:MAG: aldo/keto reductase [candidate division WOR-3 bacterium]|nr:MAG: aldo/keto reductase [candidate division WOR-3 bacterium]